jgi:DNA-binding transcriptional ArsR family regulator
LTFERDFAYNQLVMNNRNHMRNTSDRLDATFAALADPTRRAILARLAGGEASVTELARPFEISQPAISKHLKVLEHAGLIERGRDAQRRPCRIRTRPLERATLWLAAYRELWSAAARRLEARLARLERPKRKSRRRMRRRGRRA